MTNRERWIVYPLLFFAIGLGFKGQLVPPSNIDTYGITCRSLTVVSESNLPLVQIAEQNNGFPTIRLAGLADAGPPLDPSVLRARPPESDVSSQIGEKVTDELTTPRLLVELSANASGGMLRLHGPEEMRSIRVGHDREARVSGLFGEDSSHEVLTIPGDQPGSNIIPGAVIGWQMLALPKSADPEASPESKEPAAEGQEAGTASE